MRASFAVRPNQVRLPDARAAFCGPDHELCGLFIFRDLQLLSLLSLSNVSPGLGVLNVRLWIGPVEPVGQTAAARFPCGGNPGSGPAHCTPPKVPTQPSVHWAPHVLAVGVLGPARWPSAPAWLIPWNQVLHWFGHIFAFVDVGHCLEAFAVLVFGGLRTLLLEVGLIMLGSLIVHLGPCPL